MASADTKCFLKEAYKWCLYRLLECVDLVCTNKFSSCVLNIILGIQKFQNPVYCCINMLAFLAMFVQHVSDLATHHSDQSLHSAFIQLVPRSTKLKYGRQYLYFLVRYILNHLLSSAIASYMDTGHWFPLLWSFVEADDVDTYLIKTHHFSNSFVSLVEMGSVQTHQRRPCIGFQW